MRNTTCKDCGGTVNRGVTRCGDCNEKLERIRAAAPELLAACQEMVGAGEWWKKNQDSPASALHHFAFAALAARAAIAKAEQTGS